MFIRLTKFDNRPVWLNAGFIVTVEPRRDGVGSVVVPIGDGLDYDVRESPEEVLRLLDGAPAPTVVPVPVSDCLTKTPADGAVAEPPPVAEPPAAEPPKPKKRATRGRAKSSVAAKAAEEPPTEAPPPAAPSAEAEAAAPSAPPPVLELSEADVQRLRKLGPKTLGKLKNTLATQFMIADIGANVAALVGKGVFALDGNKVVWPAEA
ncbi:MAG: hypothetical protein ACI4RD_06965 [Kiritimatiellia bacterium]